ncbi:MAG TPA: VTT domain-containing protein [Xanthomonadaceae bacterium]|nr:VTT domain-containing protein [Xanthomonadaceae bacterium]
MKRGWWWLLLALLVTVLVAIGVHLGEHALFHALRGTMGQLKQLGADEPVRVVLAYFVIYVGMAAVSLPFGGLLTAAAGAMFGFWWGLLLASVSASTGALAGLVVSRYVLHAAVERRFGARLAPIHKGLHDEGAFYLFALRMVPVFPYWLLNLLMGLTTMRALTFWWVSALGLLPLEAAYVFAGTRLATIEKPSDILSPGLIAALLSVGVLPLLLRRLVRWVELRYFKHDDD